MWRSLGCEVCQSLTHRIFGLAEGGSQGVVVLGSRWGVGCSGVGGSGYPMVLGAVVFQGVLGWSELVSDQLGWSQPRSAMVLALVVVWW